MSNEEGYLLLKRQGTFRLQCFGNQQLAKETREILKEKGAYAVAVTEEELERLMEERKEG